MELMTILIIAVLNILLPTADVFTNIILMVKLYEPPPWCRYYYWGNTAKSVGTPSEIYKAIENNGQDEEEKYIETDGQGEEELDIETDSQDEEEENSIVVYIFKKIFAVSNCFVLRPVYLDHYFAVEIFRRS